MQRCDQTLVSCELSSRWDDRLFDSLREFWICFRQNPMDKSTCYVSLLPIRRSGSVLEIAQNGLETSSHAIANSMQTH